MYAAAQFAEALDSLQTASRHGGKRIAGRHKQIAERLARRAPYPASQLMQLAETEVLGIVDDDGVDIGHVDTTLYDGCGEEHIVVVVGEVDNRLLKFLGGHLAVGHDGAGVGHKAMNHLLKLVEPLDAVVDEEYLAAARHLEVNGLAHGIVAHDAHVGENRISVGRRSVDGREVARAHQGELQGARYGCSRHGECVDVYFQLFQALLHGDAEFLFLVNNEQSEVLELHRLSDEFVSAYEDVDFPFGKIGEYLACLLGGTCARQVVDTHGEILEALGECVEMLIGEHGGRHEHSGLLAVGGGLECGTDGNLGLAEANVATHKTVHRTRRLHIALYSLCGSKLVGGVLVDKRCLKLVLQIGVG